MIATSRCLFQAMILAVAVSAGVQALTYSCDPDNSIEVGGFTITANDHFYAMQGNTECKVTKKASNTAITITGCSKNAEVLVTYGSYSDMASNSLHGGTAVQAFKVMCVEIAATGVTHVVTNQFTASLSIDATPSTEPTYTVTSSLSATSATVGESVTMTITFPDSYTMEVTSCKAYPGLDDSDTGGAVTLTEASGCSSTTELISDFTSATPGSATATIEAFRFYQNDHVFIKCDVKICPSAGSANCDTSCDRSRRKRSDRFFNTTNIKDDRTNYLTREVHNVLKVTDPFENNAVAVAPIGWIIVALAFLHFMG